MPRDYDDKIAELFRLGMSRVYGKQIWAALCQLRRTQAALAAAGGLHPSQVNRGVKEGRLTFGELVALAVGLSVTFSDDWFPAMPSRRELKSGGYFHCIRKIRKNHIHNGDFELLTSAWKDDRWFRAKNDPPRQRLILHELRLSSPSANTRDRLSALGPEALEYVLGLESDYIKCMTVIEEKYPWTTSI